MQYFDELEPSPGAQLGEYYEKIMLDSENDEKVLSIEIGSLSKCDIQFHSEMWDKALKMIKRLAEKG